MDDQFFRDHFKKFLQQNSEENRGLLEKSSNPETSTVGVPERPSTVSTPINTQSDIVYENDDLRLIVEKGFHKRQKNFRLEDHLFYFKIKQKKASKMPLIIDILDFLHSAFVHVLDSIKTFYKAGIKFYFSFLIVEEVQLLNLKS